MHAKKITPRDYIKANRRASREAEIENHNRPVSFCRVHKSKKIYDRSKQKADDKRHLPSLFFAVSCVIGKMSLPETEKTGRSLNFNPFGVTLAPRRFGCGA